MRTALRLVLLAAVASVAVAGCAKKKPVGVDSNTSASDVGGFGSGSGAGSAPGGFGVGDAGAGTGQLFRDADGNLVDANGNRVDEFGNPIGGGGTVAGGTPSNVFVDANGNFVDANGNPVDQFGNPISGAGVSGGQQFDQYGNPIGGQVDQYGNPIGGGAGAGQYNFAGDDGSPGYFAQRVGDRVLFDTDSSTIDAEGQEILRRQAAWFQRHPQIAITIEGHADERGTRDYNLGLGERRANAMRSMLISFGVDQNRLRSVSYGKERPVRASSTPGAWRVNRRAVATLRGGPTS